MLTFVRTSQKNRQKLEVLRRKWNQKKSSIVSAAVEVEQLPIFHPGSSENMITNYIMAPPSRPSLYVPVNPFASKTAGKTRVG